MRSLVNVRESKHIFGTKSGKTIEGAVNRILKKEAEICGIGKFTSHGFRHSLGYHLLRRGCDMRYIQLILGHDDMNSTVLYTRVSKGDLKSELDKYHPRRIHGK